MKDKSIITHFKLTQGRYGVPRIGVVRGRRRHGKSFVLEHLCRAVNGAYLLALQESRTMALDRFSELLGRWLGFPVGRIGDWVTAIDAAVEGLTRAGVPLLVLDEFPYLAAHSPELPSVIQALYDRSGPASGGPAFRIILCGSAISVMSTLLSGGQALRGRAVIDMRMGGVAYALFSHNGFTNDLKAAAAGGGVKLVGLRELYGTG